MNNYHFEKSWADLCHYYTEHPYEFFDWLRNQPEYSLLLQEELGEKSLPKPHVLHVLKLGTRLKKWGQDLIWPNSSELYGRSYVNQTVPTYATVTAALIGSSSAINIIALFPLIRMAFLSLGPLGSGLSFGTTLLLLIASNACGTVAATSQHRHHLWSLFGFIGFTVLNISLTAVAGPGMDVLNSQASLRELKATEELQEIIAAKNAFYESELSRRKQRVQAKKDECNEINKEIASLDEGHPDRNRKIIQAQGLYQDRDRDLSDVPAEKLPICIQAKSLEGETTRYEQQVAEEKRQLQTELGKGQLIFLKKNYPEVYESHFDAEGTFRDPSEAVRLAISSFVRQLLGGQWGSLGFSLSFFVFSIVTSGAAIAIVFAYSRSQAVRQSWNPIIERMREDLFTAVDQGLVRIQTTSPSITSYGLPILTGNTVAFPHNRSEAISSERRLLWSIAKIVRQLGRFPFPPFVRYLERHPEGERLLPRSVIVTDLSKNGRLTWTRQPDIAISFLRAQVTVTAHGLATLSRSLQHPELYGDFSHHKALDALIEQGLLLKHWAQTVEESFPYSSLGQSPPLLDDLEYALAYIRNELQHALEQNDALEKSEDEVLLEYLTQKQFRTYLIHIETLSLTLFTCLIRQLEAGLEPPYLPTA